MLFLLLLSLLCRVRGQIDGTTVSNPRTVYINGGIHAREWISPATMLYIANEVNIHVVVP